MYKCWILIAVITSLVRAQENRVLDASYFEKNSISEIASVREPSRDQWFSEDKFYHLTACAALPGLTYHFWFSSTGRDQGTGKLYSVSITALIGIGKEIYDKKKKGHFSWKDIFWDSIGLAMGYLLFIDNY